MKKLREAHLLLEIFLVSNFAFLSVDIYIAHSINRFRHWAEWIPFWFSLAATVALVPNLVRSLVSASEWRPSRTGAVVGATAITVGVLGMFWHLESHFFAEQTLHNLVYAAPFIAPLSYAGLGFLLLLNRMINPGSADWGRWVILLALGGFIGNFALSTLDHAQNGFFLTTEWIPVISSAMAIGALVVALYRLGDGYYMRFVMVVLGLQIVVGVVGFGLHFAANVGGPSGWWENFLYGAPIFTPLLFPNLAVLAALGVWVLARREETARAERVIGDCGKH